MTAPIWVASPPEVHSALLSGGAGPGSLLAAAEAWKSLSAEFASAAEELSAALSKLQAGVWQGPSAEAYVAANVPYLAWLMQTSDDSAAAAVQHETAAAAYSAALAAMPTLGELAANHATHAVLMATNFFGLITIPIVLNEADYLQMWIQAATTMTTYQAVASAAVAATPRTAAAPQIQKADSTSTTGGGGSQDSGPGPTQLSWYTTRLDEVIQAIQKDLAAFPSNPSTAIYNLLHDPILTTSLPHWAGEVYLTFAPQLTQLTELSYGLIAPALSAGGVAGLAGLGAASGLTALAGLPTGAEAIPVAGQLNVPGAAPTSVAPTVMSPVSGPATAPAPAAAASAPTPAPATIVTGAPTAPPPAGPDGFPYLVGGTSMSWAATGQGKTHQPTSRSAAAAAAAVAAVAADRAPAHRRRHTKGKQLGRGYEYMDLDPNSDSEVDGSPKRSRVAPAVASNQSAGPLGFAGTVDRAGPARAAGLITLPGDASGADPSLPMIPGTWDPARAGEAEDD
jgi:PPE-repeat protein